MKSVTSMKKVVLQTLVMRSYLLAVGSTIHEPFTDAYNIRELFKCDLVNVKPIVIYMSDGASDKASLFPKPLQTGVALFKEIKLDVILHGVNAADLLAFNPAESRMASLPHD